MSFPMTVKVSQSAPCQHRLCISVPPEAIHPVREAVVREFQREASLAGFRKGKAPRELVERQYPTEIREETLRRLTRQVFEQVTQERKLKPVGPFEVTQLSFDDAKGLSLEAQMEVEPEFALAEYRGVRLTRPSVTTSPQELDEVLTRLRESMAELAPAGEGLPTPPPGEPLGGAQAGKPPQKVKRVPNLDDEFAKDVGFETLEQLKANLTAKLREQKIAEARQALEQALCEELLKRHAFEVPTRLVERQAERLKKDFQVRLLLSGLPEEQAQEKLATFTEQLRTAASRHVKLAFILERIADREGLSVTQDELVERLWKLAKRWGKDPAEVRRLLDAQGLWPSVHSSIRQEKTIEFLLGVAHIVEENGDVSIFPARKATEK